MQYMPGFGKSDQLDVNRETVSKPGLRPETSWQGCGTIGEEARAAELSRPTT